MLISTVRILFSFIQLIVVLGETFWKQRTLTKVLVLCFTINIYFQTQMLLDNVGYSQNAIIVKHVSGNKCEL